jgi:S1-C subfamily serine protease
MGKPSWRPAAAVAAGLAAATLAGCQTSTPPSASRTPGRAASAAATSGPVLPVNPAPGPSNVGTFDAAHAAAVLNPSVGLIIASGAGRSGSAAEGSGFAFSSQGGTSYVLTNNHVVQGARRVQVVMPDGRHFVADVQGTDQLEDVAVVKVSDTLPVAQFADSTRLQVGQPVVAIGSPLGSQGFGTVTTGVVSALHRTLNNVGGGAGQSPESLADVLQTDAPINPGNSGGPLGDGNGRVVAMNTAGSSNANGIGFAIPSAILQRVAQSLVQGRTPGHPYLGVCYQPVEEALAVDPNVKGFGIVVQRALSGTPADKAGIQGGDVIEKIDSTELNNGQTLGGVLQLHNPGDTVKMTALRGSGTVDLSVTLGDRPANGGASCSAP